MCNSNTMLPNSCKYTRYTSGSLCSVHVNYINVYLGRQRGQQLKEHILQTHSTMVQKAKTQRQLYTCVNSGREMVFDTQRLKAAEAWKWGYLPSARL